jgi:hypothetical protein
LVLSCHIEPDSDLSNPTQALVENLRHARDENTVASAFRQLGILVSESKCRSIGDSQYYALGQSILSNPAVVIPATRHLVHLMLAQVAVRQQDFGLTVHHFEEALRIYQNPDALVAAMRILNDAGRTDLSWQFLAEARKQEPRGNLFRRAQWRRDLDKIEQALAKLES